MLPTGAKVVRSTKGGGVGKVLKIDRLMAGGFLGLTGPAGLRIVVSPVGDGVCMPLREMKTKQPPYGHKEHANRASPVGNAPLWVLRTTSPGGGSLLYAQLLNS